MVLLRVLQEVDDLDQFVLRVVNPRDIVEGDRRLQFAVALGAAPAEAEEAAPGSRRGTAAIHTKAAISNSVGPKLTSSFSQDDTLSSTAVTATPWSDEPSLEVLVGEDRSLRFEFRRGASVGLIRLSVPDRPAFQPSVADT